VTATHGVWRVDDIKAGYTGLLVKDGILYVVADTGNLHAYDAKTGQALWTHNLGTVGKGSPVWADGKIYVMEVNGNIHILKPSREGCESLSHVTLLAANGEGTDEIYASPAIADGRIFFCTRDRTICVGRADAVVESDPIPPLPEETAPQEEIASLKLTPFESNIQISGEIEYELLAYDKNGRFLKKLDVALEPQADLPDAKADGAKLVFGPGSRMQAGYVVAKHGELTAKARVRVFPDLPWSINFDTPESMAMTAGWINGFQGLKPVEQDGGTIMRNTPGPGKPSNYVWIGPANMTGYTVQADVMMKEARRQLPSVGVSANRYNLILKGNTSKLAVQSWPPHLRMGKEVSYRSDPDVWYTMKLRVEVKDDGAHVMGKVWKRGDAEPEAWTIEQLDPHANVIGSPGIYIYSLADSYYDNVVVTKN
jgi:hypothetical protein